MLSVTLMGESEPQESPHPASLGQRAVTYASVLSLLAPPSPVDNDSTDDEKEYWLSIVFI